MGRLLRSISAVWLALGGFMATGLPAEDGQYRGGNKVLHPLSCYGTGPELAALVPGSNLIQVAYGYQGHTWTVFADNPFEKAGGWDQSWASVQFLRVQGRDYEVLKEFRYIAKTVNDGVESRTGKSTGKLFVRNLTSVERDTADLDPRKTMAQAFELAPLLTLPLQVGQEEYKIMLNLAREGLGEVPVLCEVIW